VIIEKITNNEDFFLKKVKSFIFSQKLKAMKTFSQKKAILALVVSVLLLTTKTIIGQPAPDLNFCSVSASLIFNDSVCIVGGSIPLEFNWDDGSWENMFAWIVPGGMTSVRFTPPGYPFKIIGSRINVGDGSYPEGADFLGKEMRILVFDDDGPDNLPGTVLDSITITVEHYEWNEIEGLDAIVYDGDFYIGMKQLYAPPYSPPVGIDEQNPVLFKSYVKAANGEWQYSSYQDFMIRAYSCDTQNVQRQINSGDSFWYELARISDFNPENGESPEDGTFTIIDSLSYFYYQDTLYYTLEPGYYAYAVKVYNEGVDTSGWYYTNSVYHQTTGTKEIVSDKLQIKIFPNPVNDELSVEAHQQIQSLKIYDSFGQVVANRNYDRKNITLNLNTLDRGIYFISIKTSKGSFNKKVIKL